MKANKRKNT